MSLFSLKNRTIRLYKLPQLDSQVARDTFIESRGLVLNQNNGFNFKTFFPAFSTPTKTTTQYNGKALEDLIELKEVKKISFDSTMNLGVEMGLNRSFMQPWYIEPTKISIDGVSYIGAFEAMKNASDTDLEDLYNSFTNRFVERFGDRAETVLEVTSNPDKARLFIGYITKFSFDESVDNPYLISYKIDFTGKPDVVVAKDKGKTAYGVDIEWVLSTDGKNWHARRRQ